MGAPAGRAKGASAAPADSGPLPRTAETSRGGSAGRSARSRGSEAATTIAASERDGGEQRPEDLRTGRFFKPGSLYSARLMGYDAVFDKQKEECGVFGIWAHGHSEEAANYAYLGLHALQHRGQESAGIVSTDGETLHVHREMGLVADVFNADVLARLKGGAAIGHVRYSTAGRART